eukprot:324192_1
MKTIFIVISLAILCHYVIGSGEGCIQGECPCNKYCSAAKDKCKECDGCYSNTDKCKKCVEEYGYEDWTCPLCGCPDSGDGALAQDENHLEPISFHCCNYLIPI